MLADRTVLVTDVLTPSSIAFAGTRTVVALLSDWLLAPVGEIAHVHGGAPAAGR